LASRPPEVFSFTLFSCVEGYPSPNTQCGVQGQWGNNLYGQSATRDLTREAEWISSNPAAVRIGKPGELIALSAGDADVYAIFRTMRTNSLRFRAFGDGDRPRGIVPMTEGYVPVTGAPASPVPDVSVDVIEGRNAGAKTATNARGRFMFAQWICGPATIRLTKAGYEDVVVSRVTCEGYDSKFGTIAITPVP